MQQPLWTHRRTTPHQPGRHQRHRLGGLRHLPRHGRPQQVQGLHPHHAVPEVRLATSGRTTTTSYKQQYGDDPELRRAQAAQRERFVLPAGCRLLRPLRAARRRQLASSSTRPWTPSKTPTRPSCEGVFRNIDFNCEASLGRPSAAQRPPEDTCWKTSPSPSWTCAQPRRRARRDRQRLRIPDRHFAVRRGQEGRRVLHAARSVHAAGAAARPAARRPHLRPDLRLRLAADQVRPGRSGSAQDYVACTARRANGAPGRWPR